MLPLIGLLIITTGAFSVLYIRQRSKSTEQTIVIEDQIRELETLILRVSRIDRRIAADLERISSRLKDIEE